MVTIESTAEMAAKVYETMERNLAIVRRRLGRPLTLADKVLLGHLDDPEHQEMEAGKSYLLLRPDRVVLQDVLGQTAMLQFMQTRRLRVAVPTTIHCDHLIQARVDGPVDLLAAEETNSEVYDFLRTVSAQSASTRAATGDAVSSRCRSMSQRNSSTCSASGRSACTRAVLRRAASCESGSHTNASPPVIPAPRL